MELSFVRGLYDTPGPWASVYLDATHDTEPARAAIKIRWKNLRASLSGHGIDERTLQSLETELIDEHTSRPLDGSRVEGRPHAGRHGLALFAAQGAVRYAELIDEPPRSDIGEASALPFLTPLLGLRGEQVPWLRVIVNRVGADLEDGAHDTIRAEGTHLFPIRKTHGGGWSEENLHRKAEMRWQHRAQEVAERISQFAALVGAELVIVAGDLRARGLLIEQLPERWRERVVEVEAGSRAPGADLSTVDLATRQAVTDAVERRYSAAIDRFTVRGGEYAATGLPAVLAAFDRGQVETLLLDPDGVAKAQLWLGVDQSQLAVDEDELNRSGSTQIERVRAEDALIRAAAMTDAELVVVSPGRVQLEDGVGAVLRYVDPSTPHR
jgi:Bacterial archaeo-eukaryotic release factor family 2